MTPSTCAFASASVFTFACATGPKAVFSTAATAAATLSKCPAAALPQADNMKISAATIRKNKILFLFFIIFLLFVKTIKSFSTIYQSSLCSSTGRPQAAKIAFWTVYSYSYEYGFCLRPSTISAKSSIIAS